LRRNYWTPTPSCNGPAHLKRIEEESGGEVTANDFIAVAREGSEEEPCT
jgi:hypothetical protein